MAAINKDTRLVMTILFVGAVSGMNVYFYANYGAELPWTPLSHAVLFSLITIGFVMGIKAVFDLIMNDRMELWLLDRKISMYWEKRKREETQRNKIVDSMRQYNVNPYMQNNQEVPAVFLEGIEPWYWGINVLLDLFGLDETSVAYDMTRAHSADLLFLKARAFMWCITTGVACLLIGNICGVFGINYFGAAWDFISNMWH